MKNVTFVATVFVCALTFSTNASAQNSLFNQAPKSNNYAEELAEREIQKAKNRMNAEEVVAMEKDLNRDIEYAIENTSPSDMRKLIDLYNQTEKKQAREDGLDYQYLDVDVYDKEQVRDFYTRLKSE